MADEATTTPEVEVKTPEAETTEDVTTTETSKTISEVMGDKPVKDDPKTVGLDKFLDEKKARKSLEKEVRELRKLVEEGGTKEEISESLSELSEEYPDVDPKFLNKLVNTIKAEAQKEINQKFEPLEKKEKETKLQAIFKKGFGDALETMPEYSKIVNEDVIFKLSLLPENGNKTFSQLIEDTYSNALGGKRTFNTTTPRGGKEPEPLDITKAAKDPAYFAEVMNDPKLKAEYNKAMLYKGF